MILAGTPPKQVVYLDGEGEGGDIFIRPDYIDRVFEAWDTGDATVDWRNIRANPALGNVGGAPHDSSAARRIRSR